jgi:hypothetical protein
MEEKFEYLVLLTLIKLFWETNEPISKLMLLQKHDWDSATNTLFVENLAHVIKDKITIEILNQLNEIGNPSCFSYMFFKQ